MLLVLNALPFYTLVVTCTIYLLNVQQSCNKRDVIILRGHYGLIMPPEIIDRHYSVYEKLQATRAKVAPVNLIYGSHFSATEATNIVSQNMKNL